MNDEFARMYQELLLTRLKVEELEFGQTSLIRAHREPIESEIWERFDADHVLARIFLLIDGKRTQNDIVTAATHEGIGGVSPANLSKKLRDLRELNLIVLAPIDKPGNVYRLSKTAETLSICKKLRRRLKSAGTLRK